MELELTTADGPVRAVWARDAEGALTLALSAPADRRRKCYTITKLCREGFHLWKGHRMDKIRVEICCGTACYILGASRLVDLEGELPPEIRERVEVEARPCLNFCDDERLGGAPYVRINGTEVLPQATPESVLLRLRELCGEEVA